MNKRAKIEEIIAQEFDVEPEFRQRKTQLAKYVIPKKVLCSVMYNKEEVTFKEIAAYLGYADHSTVMYHVKDLDNMCITDDSLCAKVDRVFDAASKLYYLNQEV